MVTVATEASAGLPFGVVLQACSMLSNAWFGCDCSPTAMGLPNEHAACIKFFHADQDRRAESRDNRRVFSLL